MNGLDFFLERKRESGFVINILLFPLKRSSMSNSPSTVHPFIAVQSPDSSDDDEIGFDFDTCPCKLEWEANGKKQWSLFAMLAGLISGDGRDLGDTEVSPHKEMKFRKSLVPTSMQCRMEVKRRCSHFDMEEPQCKHWNKEKLLDWLKAHAVDSMVDREWLIKEEKKVHDLLTSAVKEKESANNVWSMQAWIRLCFCLCDERVRPYFNAKDNALDREELDARNHEDRPPTLFQAIADLMNDPEVVFELPAKPELHHLFSAPLQIGADVSPGKVTAEDVKRRLSESRARLLKTISKWELSGNGFGQRAFADDEFGHLDEEMLEDGDNRARFLDGIGREHLLILWDLGDHEGVLQQFLNKLSLDVAVDPDNIHTDTSKVQNKRGLSDEQQATKAFRESIAKSMSAMSCAALLSELRESEKQAFQLKEYSFKSHDDGAVAFCEESYARQMERIKLIQEEMGHVKRQRSD